MNLVFFLFGFFRKGLTLESTLPGVHCIAKGDLKLVPILLQQLKCWVIYCSTNPLPISLYSILHNYYFCCSRTFSLPSPQRNLVLVKQSLPISILPHTPPIPGSCTFALCCYGFLCSGYFHLNAII